MLYDKIVLKAVTGIRQRSERQNNLDVVSKTFVDPGILIAVDNKNHQVIFGRRGTGKTHVLRKLQSQATNNKNRFVCYVDCRTMGSTAQYSDRSLSIKHRSYSIFKDILSELHDVLLNRIVEVAPANSDELLSCLDEFFAEFSTPQQIVKTAVISDKVTQNNSKEESAGVGIAIAGKIGFDLSRKSSTNGEQNQISEYTVEFDEKAVFSSITRLLKSIVNGLGGDLLLLIDEWSSIPIKIQPYLAEFIKRGILPCDNVTVKIAALEFRSNFLITNEGDYTGLELGADISTAPSMDSFYTGIQRENEIAGNFSEMLYRHISSELPFEYLRKRYHISSGERLMDVIFESNAFVTLAQASEGVVRDLINIFIMAFSRVHNLTGYEQRTKISRTIIYESSKQWFDRDKLQGLNGTLQDRFANIVRTAITVNKSRYFVVSRSCTHTTALDQLVDLRVMHLSNASFMSLVEEESLFKVYNIDFGSYASLMTFDNRTKYQDMPFFDKNGFSKYPAQTEHLERYYIDEALLKQII